MAGIHPEAVRVRRATNDELREACRLLGYTICAAHEAAAGHREFRTGLLATLSVLAGAQAADTGFTDREAERAELFAHNVMVNLGLDECDGPEHVLSPDSCCGPRPAE